MQFDLGFLYIIIQVIFLEGILSIDNAAVLGAMVSVLPKQDRVPWPTPLKSLGPPTHRLLGGQRSSALKVVAALAGQAPARWRARHGRLPVQSALDIGNVGLLAFTGARENDGPKLVGGNIGV